MRQRILPLVAALLVLARALAAQNASGSTWLKWTTYDVLVSADTVRGVGLWILPHGQRSAVPAGIVGGDYYAPEDVVIWLRGADSLLSAQRPDSDDARDQLLSQLLPNRADGGLFLVRAREKDRWSRKPLLGFIDSLKHVRLVVRGNSELAASFTEALRRAAAVSRIQPITSELERDIHCTMVCGITTRNAVPAKLVDIPQPRYPPELAYGGHEGTVLLSYIVDTNGRADSGSVVVRFTTGPGFSEAAITAIRAATFTPATIDGQPVRQCVQQRVSFRLHR